MVELVVISPLIIVMWASINYFRNCYLMSQQVLHESRTQAWARATSGDCERGASGDLPSSPLIAAMSNSGTFGTEVMGSFATFHSGTILSGTATVDAKVSRVLQHVPRVTQFAQKPIPGRTFLHCNDKLPHPDGDLIEEMTGVGLKELRVP